MAPQRNLSLISQPEIAPPVIIQRTPLKFRHHPQNKEGGDRGRGHRDVFSLGPSSLFVAPITKRTTGDQKIIIVLNDTNKHILDIHSDVPP